MKKNSIISILILFLTAIIWGFAFAFQADGGETLGTFWFNGIRFIIGALSLIPVVLIFERGKLTGKQWKNLLVKGSVCGAILFSASALQQYGIFLTGSSAKAGFITGLYMVFVPFCGIFMHKRIRAEAWIGAAVAIVGLYFVSFAGGAQSVEFGDLVVLIGAFFWTAHIVFIDTFAGDCPSLKFSLVQFVVCGALNLICAPIFESGITVTWAVLTGAAVPLLYCGIFSVGVAYTCQVIGQRGTEPALASIILCTESVFAAIGGWLLRDEFLGVRGYMGCALIFVGILLSQAKIFKKSKPNA
ncbi:MAG: DMT family transporter [Clostridia bacterium]|nr:DMT family transporter [Clostridia bacterium]